MSDSDDDLLALADVQLTNEPLNPYPLEGKYKDAEDRAKLDAMPEIEREQILYDRAQEMLRFEEKQYLAQRRRQMSKPIPPVDGMPSAKRQRGTTGISSGTQDSLAKLKERREAQNKRKHSKMVSDNDFSDEDTDTSEQDNGESDYSDDDATSKRRSRRYNSSKRWESESENDSEEDVANTSLMGPIKLADVNQIRWGKSLFAKFSQYPKFHDVVPGCFVRVAVGSNKQGRSVYRLCMVKRVCNYKPYKVNDRVVDEAIVASMGDSERVVRFDTCSDRLVEDHEFEFWKTRMDEANLSLPTVRRARTIYEGVRELSKRVLTSSEIDALVARRAKLNGAKGANAVLKKAELMHQREIAIDEGNNILIKEIDDKLKLSSSQDQKDEVQHLPVANKTQDVLVKVNERNRKANNESVRKAEIQLHNERRKAGSNLKIDPFSRLKTNARTFYKATEELGETPAEIQQTLEDVDQSVPLAALDDLIAKLDIPITIEI